MYVLPSRFQALRDFIGEWGGIIWSFSCLGGFYYCCWKVGSTLPPIPPPMKEPITYAAAAWMFYIIGKPSKESK